MTDLPAFTINRMTVINSTPNAGGTRVLATYDLRIAGLMAKGCVLLQDARGVISAKGLLGKTSQGAKLLLTFDSPELEQAVTEKVVDAYRALMGGRAAAE